MGAEDTMASAMDMAATGVGLGIMTMGAMVPIKAMNKMMDVYGNKKRKRSKKSRKK
jgi:hypothetical protein